MAGDAETLPVFYRLFDPVAGCAYCGHHNHQRENPDDDCHETKPGLQRQDIHSLITKKTNGTTICKKIHAPAHIPALSYLLSLKIGLLA
jgi:hypothetical protein